jgi:hypothetical protein
MKALCRNDRRFLAKVNPSWWKILVDKAKEEIGDLDGEFVLLWSDELEQHFMMYNSESKKGKLKRKCVLTNAFINTKNKSLKKRMFA